MWRVRYHRFREFSEFGPRFGPQPGARGRPPAASRGCPFQSQGFRPSAGFCEARDFRNRLKARRVFHSSGSSVVPRNRAQPTH